MTYRITTRKAIATLAVAVWMLAGHAVQAQSEPQRQQITEADGFTWMRYTFEEPSGTTFAAFTNKGVRITPNSPNHIRYIEGGFFEVTERIVRGEPFIHHLYNIQGNCIVCRSMAKHVIRIYPEEKLIVAWRYNPDYTTIPGTIETFSFDGRYYAEGDYSTNAEAFDVAKRPMGTYPLASPVQPTAGAVAQATPQAEPTQAAKPQPAAQPAVKPQPQPAAAPQPAPKQQAAKPQPAKPATPRTDPTATDLTETGKRPMKGPDGFAWELRTYRDRSGATRHAAFNTQGQRLTDYTPNAIRYRAEGFFELTSRKQGSAPLVHYLYDKRGNIVVPQSAAKNVIKIYPEEKLIVAWSYMPDYSVIESTVETYSYDGHYTAGGDLALTPGAFEERKSPVSWNRHVEPQPAPAVGEERPSPTPQAVAEVRHEARPQPAPEHRPTPKPRPEHKPAPKPEPRPAPQPAKHTKADTAAADYPYPIFAAVYKCGKGTNPDNGLVVEPDGVDPEINIWSDHLTENGYMARLDHTTAEGMRVYVGGFVGMKAVYKVAPDHTVTKQLFFNSPAGRYSYIYTLTPKR